MQRPFPKAQKHGELHEIFSDIFFVIGSLTIRRLFPMRFSRNMTVVKEGHDLVLINSVRLKEDGLKALEQLGEVKHVIRLAGFHGLDDAFYRQRYRAKIWSVNAPYSAELTRNPTPDQIYLEPDEVLSSETRLPIQDAQLISIDSSTPHEALLLIKRENGVLVSGDCFQNWQKPDAFFNFFAKIMMKRMGFLKPYNIGPGWYKLAKPEHQDLQKILDYDFQHVLPAHGTPVLDNAKNLYRPAIEALTNPPA